MSIYDDYAYEPLVQVMHPVKRVLMAVPASLLKRYWRAEEGFIYSANWDALKTWDEIARERGKAGAKSMAKRTGMLAVQLYWEAVRDLPGGTDPLWHYGSDERRAPQGILRPIDEASPWIASIRLRMRYGTTSLSAYAAKYGVYFPE